MAHHRRLGQARQADRAGAREAAQPVGADVRFRPVHAEGAGAVLLEDQGLLDAEAEIAGDRVTGVAGHDNASARASTSSAPHRFRHRDQQQVVQPRARMEARDGHARNDALAREPLDRFGRIAVEADGELVEEMRGHDPRAEPVRQRDGARMVERGEALQPGLAEQASDGW